MKSMISSRLFYIIFFLVIGFVSLSYVISRESLEFVLDSGDTFKGRLLSDEGIMLMGLSGASIMLSVTAVLDGINKYRTKGAAAAAGAQS